MKKELLQIHADLNEKYLFKLNDSNTRKELKKEVRFLFKKQFPEYKWKIKCDLENNTIDLILIKEL